MQVVRLQEQQPDRCQMDKCCTTEANKSCNSTPAGLVSPPPDINMEILQDLQKEDGLEKKKKKEEEILI